MKFAKIILITFCITIFLFVLCSCKSFATALPFIYKQDIAHLDSNDAGVVTSGFINTDPCIVSNADKALELAKKEATDKYSNQEIFFDSQDRIWKIYFSNNNVLGGDVTVYLDSSGITKLIVLGK